MNEINSKELDNYILRKPNYKGLEDMYTKEIFDFIDDLNNQIDELKKQTVDLKSQLANIKYINADEVEKIFNDCLPEDFNFEEEKILTMTDQENIIQAICKLAIPDIDRDRIAQEIEHESMNLIGVIHEIIQRCFIDYEKLPKANDIKGKL